MHGEEAYETERLILKPLHETRNEKIKQKTATQKMLLRSLDH